MELWIRSQDRTKLVKSNYLSLFLSDTTWFIYTDTETGEPFSIGKYKTEERALKVLDEIQSKIAENKCLEVMLPKVTDIRGYEEQYGRMFKETIYQMPKE